MDIFFGYNLLEAVGVTVATVFALVLCAIVTCNIKRKRDESLFNQMKGRYVAITGCDSGFGRLTATRLATQGAKVIAGCLRPESLHELKTGEGGENIIPVLLDVSSDQSCIDFVENAKKIVKSNNAPLDGFVNNAGVFICGPSEWHTREQIRRVFEVNTFGAMDLANRLAPLLDQSRGRMVTVSSVSAMVHGPQLAVYGASKAALDNFISSMKVETLRKFSTHLILPGGFRTPLLSPQTLDRTLNNYWSNTNDQVRRDYGEQFREKFITNYSEGVVKYASSDIGSVVSAVEHALFGTYPRLRYYIGLDAKFFFGPLTFLPTCIQDFFLRAANKRLLKDATMASPKKN